MWTSILLQSVFICGYVFDMPEFECCHVKTVGNYTYTLVNSSIPVPPSCMSPPCAYIRDDDLSGPYCFAIGNLTVRCREKGCGGTTVPPPPNNGISFPPPHHKKCDVLVVRGNASDLNLAGSQVEELNNEMRIIKGYNNSVLYSFENIGNYHGMPFLCNIEQSEISVANFFDCAATRNNPYNYPCCINHLFIRSWDEMFGPWHRLLTLQMELALRGQSNTTLGMPYWDWTSVNEIPPIALQGEWKNGPVKCQGRNTTRKVHHFPTQKLANRVKQAYKQRSTAEFNLYLAEPHIYIHDLVGGDMGDGPKTSAFDPVFYLHHSQIDYVYAFWQELQMLRNVPVPFENYDWEMEPFRRQGSGTINPFEMTLDNAKPGDGLDYEKKFCYKYDKLLFKGQTPGQLLKNCTDELKKASFYAGYTDKFSGIASRTYFNLKKGSTIINKDLIGPVSSFGNNNTLMRAENRDNLNEYLLEVTDLLTSTNLSPLDKTLQFEVSCFLGYDDYNNCTYNKDYNNCRDKNCKDKSLNVTEAFKPTVTYRIPDTEHYVMRIHVDHVESYSPTIYHCHLSSSVEFLTDNGHHSDQVTLETRPITGKFPIKKMMNKFVVKQNYPITIGYYPGCHLQCGPDGLPRSEYPGVHVVPWNLNWIKCHGNDENVENEIVIPRFSGSVCSGLGIPDVTVFIAWCQGQETDIVKIDEKKDFDDCNLGDASNDVIIPPSKGSVDGFIAVQNTTSGIYYFASRKLCKYGFKIAIKITG